MWTFYDGSRLMVNDKWLIDMASLIKKRIGNTLLLRWQVTTDGNNIPFDGRDLTLRLVDPVGIARNMKFNFASGTNIAEFKFQGIDQTRIGAYTLEMWENKGQVEQVVVDKTEAFELVRHTKDED